MSLCYSADGIPNALLGRGWCRGSSEQWGRRCSLPSVSVLPSFGLLAFSMFLYLNRYASDLYLRSSPRISHLTASALA